MSRWLALAFIASIELGCLTGHAFARGMGASPPAGMVPATAPGGTKGIAGPHNTDNAICGGQAFAVPPGTGGIQIHRPAFDVYRAKPGGGGR